MVFRSISTTLKQLHKRSVLPVAALLLPFVLAPSGFAVDFATQVHPILSSKCVPCHTGEKAPAGLVFTGRPAALKGGASGPALSPGDSQHSLLILKVTGQKGAVMPPVGEPLTSEQIATLKTWIDEGAVWPDTTAASKEAGKWESPIAPRQPAVPEGTEPNPIDRFVDVYFKAHGIKMAAPVADTVFARRAYFDLWGLPPTANELDRFLSSKDPHKREQLIDSLLANREMYAGNWISWWNDLLRNDTGVNYQGDRKSITPWLMKALEQNMHYDRMITSLINPVAPDDPEGFLIGVNWRGTVNASQTPYMQAAQNTGQVFLGVNVKCASCHDSFINKYKLRQTYGMAALFTPEPKLELVRCDVKQGTFVGPALLYPELGTIPENASLADRHAAAAKFFTDPRNGRVPRTIVNRYWQKLFGHGLVDNVDEMDAQPWHEDLLDWLASDFTAHGSDLQYLLRELMTSRAYQLPATLTTEKAEKTYVFRGPQVRRLSAEQFADTVSYITGEWRTRPKGREAVFVRDWEVKSSPLAFALGRPVRDQVFTTRDNRATTFQALELVNGSTLESTLHRGSLRLLGELPAAPSNVFDSGQLRKGKVAIDVDISKAKQLWLLTEDAGSYDPSRTIAGWANIELSGPQGTKKLKDIATLSKFSEQDITAEGVALGKSITVPLNKRMLFPIDGLGFTRMRGTVGLDDRSKPSDIGGSVRFFVFTAEPDAQRLVRIDGAPPLPFPGQVKDVDSAVEELYVTLFSRRPSSQELGIGRQYFAANGAAAKLEPAALQDFVWSLLLHPDFEYIY